MATKKIKFVLSPTGAFNLGYNVGETAVLEEKQADLLIEASYAVPVDKKKKASTETED